MIFTKSQALFFLKCPEDVGEIGLTSFLETCGLVWTDVIREFLGDATESEKMVPSFNCFWKFILDQNTLFSKIHV